MSDNLYMVPYDFTEVGDKALEYALHVGKHVRTEILLLHLAKDKKTGLAKRDRLQQVADSVKCPPGVSVSTKTIVGSIFTDISRIAKQEKAQLIVMGTHGKKGMQKLFGSKAMKVVISADCPFLVVQKQTQLNEIKNISVPIDLTKESLQIVNLAGDLANIFAAKIHILAEKQTDQLLDQRIKNRLSIVSKTYEERDLEASVTLVKKRGKYRRKVLNHAKEHKVDLIAIAYHSESLFPQFDDFAQKLLINKQGLPVLVINSKLASALYF